ncbi:CoA-binding protein [Alkalihalobacterium sp. APHAB7]|uniref:CoA-binding protein n=1 Tax=Alkalihalobacterium sp. APHAB7 TaxID=3402081 RepID=UPI003AAC26F9
MTVENPSRTEIGEILKRSKRIAVVGLSTNPERTSYMVSEAMQNAGFEIIPVNPAAVGEEILGVKAVGSLKDIDGHVDIVNVFRRSEHLLEVAKEAVDIKPDVYWAQLGLQSEEAFNYLQEHGVTTIMDRCIKVEHALTK